MRLLIALIIVTLLSALPIGKSIANDNPGAIKSGRAKAQGCTRCHGREGIRRASARSGFKGSTGAFATRELVAFRNGTRSQPIMNGVARNLSDQDIQEIALWLNSIE